MSDVAFLRETESALLNAPFQADGWHQAIDMVARATGSPSANLVAIGGPLLMPLNMFTGRAAQQATDYFANPALWGSCNWRVQSSGEPMSIQYERHYALARSAGGTADYDDAVSDLDMQFGCQSALISDSRNFLGLAIFRGRREGPSTEIVLDRFRHLLKHVQRAVRVQLALDGEAAELMLGDLASVHCRTVLLDRHGCLNAVTPLGEDLFDEGGPARLDGLAFGLRDPAEDRQMHRAMARLLAAANDTHGPQLHEMRAGRSAADPAGRWRLFIVRLPQRRSGLGFDAQLAISFRPVQCSGLASGAQTATLG